MSASVAIDVWRIHVYRRFDTPVSVVYIIMYTCICVCVFQCESVSVCACICVYISVILSMLYVCVYESTVNSVRQLKALVTLVNVRRHSIMGQKQCLIDSRRNANGFQLVCMGYVCGVCSVYYIPHSTIVHTPL